MKATGIVRRIDDLGRVVIPKEIRRTQRIRCGDPLEIYTSHEGDVIFKKYSPIGELSPVASQYADVLYRTAGLPVMVTDRDRVIAVSGGGKKDYLDQPLSAALEKAIENRRILVTEEAQGILPCDNASRPARVIAPIITQGDVVGSVLLLEEEGKKQPDETEVKLTCVAAAFLAKQLEE
ncbi:MAG: stage V sporulation T C-terminal domain-containing protein [Oscillospiraceae bacterium]|nr:stage V sporulation T C-terminal domain-containing protein [Oscillospiraceae bacterium]